MSAETAASSSHTAASSRAKVFGVPSGYDALWIAEQARHKKGTALRPVLHVASDDTRMEELAETLHFFAPDVQLLRFPAWDCLPYDRISPTAEVVGERLKTLAALLAWRGNTPLVVLTTVAAATQRVTPRRILKDTAFSIRAGGTLNIGALQEYLAANGYHRTETVREAGEFAIRGGLIDIFPSGASEPLRIDCFGDDIENIRTFDALTQRTTAESPGLDLYPVSEILLNETAIQHFRRRYREVFGAVRDEDPLYESVSAGRKYAGMEHWLPFFYDGLETVFDYLPQAIVTLDEHAEESRDMRFKQVDDLYQARLSMMQADNKNASVYRPVPLGDLYVPAIEWHRLLSTHDVLDLVPFAPVPGQTDGGGRKGRDFGDIRALPGGGDLYAVIRDHIAALEKSGKGVLIAAYSDGAAARLTGLLQQHGVTHIANAKAGQLPRAGGKTSPAIAVLGLARGFETADLAVLTEQDLLGDRLTRVSKRKKKSDAFIFEISQLHEGDYVVHEEHGVGQFEKLETLVVDGIPHDCLKLIYAGGDKLYVPVENLDVLSRYGSAEAGTVLDRLGGAAWQARKARVKRDLLALANDLLKIAAQRVLRHTEPIENTDGSYQRFEAGFPYPETEDQQKAIQDVIDDLAKDQAMDRLVCGDVGFGKTEVALRAAALAALAGYQVAVIAPTTLLARQHYQGFSKRFNGFPVRIGQLSRFVSAAEAKKVKEGLASGDINIVVGTHALLSGNIKFSNLALLIVDEEQKFGVKQKEALKNLRDNIHVLTLTATPIPRTLQMSLSGVRELSLITTAPIDRLAVKTFVLPFDPVVLRDALMREHYRGGQSFCVCPRIFDLADMEGALREIVPELKIIVAHGQMGTDELEDKMTAFYEGAYDVLLSTAIIESGLDIPNANTMIVHRAEMFGLAQLYQMRGRIGRSKQRAYAYLTYEPGKRLTKAAEQRLHAIEQLDTLGAGFQLASHDLDIRGAGNLLGEEQSGHIKEIGVELYQQMLEEAVAAAKSGGKVEEIGEYWSPQINLGLPVMIPEAYIPDLNLRLSIYRRIADLADRAEIEDCAAELIDRFGPLPEDVENLLDLVEIKQVCRHIGIQKVEAGPKGAVMTFHPASRIDIAKLVQFISKQMGTAKLRPEDQKLVFVRAWDDIKTRMKGVFKVLTELSTLVG